MARRLSIIPCALVVSVWSTFALAVNEEIAGKREQVSVESQSAKPTPPKRRRPHGADVGLHAREDSLNRMMSLFASAPRTLESPAARKLLAQVRAMAEGRGAATIQELARVATAENSRPLPPRPQVPPKLMRRADKATDSGRERQRGQGAVALAQSGGQGAGRAVGSLREFPPLPEPVPGEKQVYIPPEEQAAIDARIAEEAAAKKDVSTDTSSLDALPNVEKGFQAEHEEFPIDGITTTAPPWWQSLPATLDDVPPPNHYNNDEVAEYWIEDGCRFGVGAPLAGSWSLANMSVAKVQCCSTGQGAACSRKVNEMCISTENSEFVTHSQAKQICEGHGMRLCSKNEMHDSPDALGCCGQGCGMDDFFTWTDTLSPKSEAVLNRKLTSKINNLRSRNLRLLKEHLSMELRLQALKDSMTDEMRITTTPWVQTASSEEVNNIITRNTDLKQTYDVLKEENEMLRRRLTDMMEWSKHERILAPRWFQEMKEHWQDTSRYAEQHLNKTWKKTPAEWGKKDKLDLHWIHRYDDKDWGWRWTTHTTTIWYRHEGDNKFHGRMGQYDSWPPVNEPGQPDSEFWPVEKPVPTKAPPPRPEWLPQPPAKGHLENYEEAKHQGLLNLNYEPLWNRYR